MIQGAGSVNATPPTRSVVVVSQDPSVVTTVEGAAGALGLMVQRQPHYDRPVEDNQGTIVVACVVDLIGRELQHPLVTQPSPSPPAVVIVDRADGKALETLRRGAWDVVEMPIDSGELQRALRTAVDEGGRRAEDRQLIEDHVQRLQALTTAEREVLEAVCEGKLNKQIARELDVSIRTIEQRRRRVFNKMDVPSAVPLAQRVAEVRTLQRLAKPPQVVTQGNAQGSSGIPGSAISIHSMPATGVPPSSATV